MRWSALFLAVFIFACGADKESAKFKSFESAFTDNPNEENLTALLNEYYQEISPDPRRPEAKQAMVRAASFFTEQKQPGQAVGFLNTLVKEFPDDESKPEWILSLSDQLQAIGKNTASEMLNRCFVEAYPEHKATAEIRSKLTNPEMPLDSFVQKIGLSMFQKDNKGIDEQIARSYVDACEAFVLVFPKDPRAVDFLQKGSEMARTLQDIDKAISLYDWIIESYPQHPKAPQALFLKAFTFDNNLKDYDNARKYYNEFINKYPDDDFADDCKFLLSNLGKSDEEILQILQSPKK